MPQDPMVLATKRIALGILAQTQRDGATDLVMAPAPGGGISFRYLTGGTWHHCLKPLEFPSRLQMVGELGGLAGIRELPYPKEGIIYVAYSGVRIRWRIQIADQNGERLCHNLENDLV